MYGWVSYDDYMKLAKKLNIALFAVAIVLVCFITAVVFLLMQFFSREALAPLEEMVESLQASNQILEEQNSELTEQLVSERELFNSHLVSISAAIDSIGILQNQIVETAAELDIKNEALDEYAHNIEFLQEIINLGSNNARVDFNNLRVASNATESQLNQILRGSPLENYGWIFLTAERDNAVNALILIGIIRKESNLGRSNAGPNNIAGIRGGGGWASFSSMEECINFLARLLNERYLTVGGAFYNGLHLEGVNIRYAVTPGGSPNWEWSSGIRTIVARDLSLIS